MYEVGSRSVGKCLSLEMTGHRLESRVHSYSGKKNVKGYKTTYQSSPLLNPQKLMLRVVYWVRLQSVSSCLDSLMLL